MTVYLHKISKFQITAVLARGVNFYWKEEVANFHLNPLAPFITMKVLKNEETCIQNEIFWNNGITIVIILRWYTAVSVHGKSFTQLHQREEASSFHLRSRTFIFRRKKQWHLRRAHSAENYPYIYIFIIRGPKLTKMFLTFKPKTSNKSKLQLLVILIKYFSLKMNYKIRPKTSMRSMIPKKAQPGSKSIDFYTIISTTNSLCLIRNNGLL